MNEHMLHTLRLQLRAIVQMLVVILGPAPSKVSISNMGGRVSSGQCDVTDCHFPYLHWKGASHEKHQHRKLVTILLATGNTPY